MCLVEGHGDKEAVPVVVRRVAAYLGLNVTIRDSIRVSRSALAKADQLGRYVRLASAKAGPAGAILIVFDADEDCPAELATLLLPAAQTAAGRANVGLVLAKREFEAWLLAAAESLRGRRGLGETFMSPAPPEEVRSPKQRLSAEMGRDRGYKETTDQPALAALFDIDLARSRSDSFDKLCREVERLLGMRG
ncbi:MAG: DUF4276 family protein [Dehalococcoidia bacterium]